jgi:AMP phosphorylase
MKLKVKILDICAGDRPIVVMNDHDAEDLGVRSLGRVSIKHGEDKAVAVLNTTHNIIDKGQIGVMNEIAEELQLKGGQRVSVTAAQFPKSIDHIKAKLDGKKLNYTQLKQIVDDVVAGNLSQVEITAFVTALHAFGIDIDEAAQLSRAMCETGQSLKINSPYIVDKHSIGGVPGDKTTMLVVPIIAAAGVTIPKTSSRAITSAAGTADRAEVLMPVNLDLEQMKAVVKKTNGCMVWGGTLDLAPADDIFIRVEYPLSIDPLLMPSIMSKKKSVGAEYLVVDIPFGRGAKMQSVNEARGLARSFIEMGSRMDIKVHCALTHGEQPLGYNIGAALEAKEALEVIMRKKSVPDVVDKAKGIAAILLSMTGMDGPKAVEKVWNNGSAEKKLRDIIFEQGGDPEVQPDDIEFGKYGFDVHAEKKGNVMMIDNHKLASLARAAGSPKDKGAGIQLYKKTGDKVDKGQRLFTVYSETPRKLKVAQEVSETCQPMLIGSSRAVVVHHITEEEVE